MWIFLPNSMLSIVEKPGDAEVCTLTVRARVAGDIERVFPNAKVTEGAGTDYRGRATIPREQVAKAVLNQVMDVDYTSRQSNRLRPCGLAYGPTKTRLHRGISGARMTGLIEISSVHASVPCCVRVRRAGVIA
jgi:hypothetical protein